VLFKVVVPLFLPKIKSVWVVCFLFLSALRCKTPRQKTKKTITAACRTRLPARRRLFAAQQQTPRQKKKPKNPLNHRRLPAGRQPAALASPSLQK
jgi:hypothetical protein